MPWWLSLLNAVVAVGTAGFGIAAVVRPSAFAPPGATTTVSVSADSASARRFYPTMYAARSVPLGLLVAVAVWQAPGLPVTALVLAAAAAAQVGDVAIAWVHRLPGMAVGAVLAGALHAAGALAVAWSPAA